MSSISASGTLYLRSNGSGDVQTSIDNSNWTTVSAWPLTINNSSAASSTYLTVLFTQDIIVNQSNQQYFICGTNYIQFGNISLNSDGTNPTVTIQNILNYPGLIQNGSAGGNGKNYIRIYNLNVAASGTTTIANSGGWVGQQYFSRGASYNYIVNCSSNGNITEKAGGILGANVAVFNASNIYVVGCNSSGSTIAQHSGGIIGYGVASDGGNISIDKCFNTGTTIGTLTGGITGASTAGGDLLQNGGNVIITRCYTTGSIGQNGGGIVGLYSVKDLVTPGSIIVSNCYTRGQIGFAAGGIIARQSGQGSLGSITVTNCYSFGFINEYAGGIYGYDWGTGALASNCYTTGSNNPGQGISQGRGIFSFSASDNPSGSSGNYSELNNGSSGWKDSNAILSLTGIPLSPNPLGTAWITTGSNTPYILREIGFSPYSINNITAPATLNVSYAETILIGQTSNAAVLPAGYTYDILVINNSNPTSFSDISINSSTGQITAALSSIAGTYTIIIRNQITGYAISTFNLTLNDISPPTPPTPAPITIPPPPISDPNVPDPNPQTTNFNADVITYKKTGTVLFGAVDNFYAGVASGGRTAHSQPLFKSNYDYINYLQGKYR